MQETKQDVFDKVAGLINETITEGDFSGLSDKIAQLTASAVSSVGEGVRKWRKPIKKPIYQLKSINRSGNMVLGVVAMLAGGMFGIVAVVFLVLTIAHFLPAFLVLLIITGAVSGVSFFGMRQFLKNTRAYDDGVRFEKITQDADRAKIADLADALNQSEKDTKKQLQRLIKTGILPEAHLDQREEYVYLTREAYREYQTAAEAEGRSAQERKAAEAALPEEARRVIREGTRYVQEIHTLGQNIADPAVKSETGRMEETIYRILNQVRMQPSCAPSLHKFLNYYLPTTIRILKACKELERDAQAGAQAADTRREITETIKTINEAYRSILEDLQREQNWDLQSDMAVMRTIMKQDGLTGQAAGQAPQAAGAAQAAAGQTLQAAGAAQTAAGTQMQQK